MVVLGYVITGAATLVAAVLAAALAYIFGLRRDQRLERAKRTADAFAQFVRATVDAQSALALKDKAEDDPTKSQERIEHWTDEYREALNSATQARTLMLTFGSQAVVNELLAGFADGEFNADCAQTPENVRRVAMRVRIDLDADEIKGAKPAKVADFLVRPDPDSQHADDC